MTFRQACERIGCPIPNDAKVCLDGYTFCFVYREKKNNGHCFVKPVFHFQQRIEIDGPKWAGVRNGYRDITYVDKMDLSNVPVRDIYESLPKGLKELIYKLLLKEGLLNPFDCD